MQLVLQMISLCYPPPPAKRNGGTGNTVRHDYCAIRRPLEGVVWVISQTRNSDTYTRTWATCRSGADFLVRIHPGSINCAEQYCGTGSNPREKSKVFGVLPHPFGGGGVGLPLIEMAS
jgi:hypothetical protein